MITASALSILLKQAFLETGRLVGGMDICFEKHLGPPLYVFGQGSL